MVLAWLVAGNPYTQLGTGNSDTSKLRCVADDESGNITMETATTAFDNSWHTVVLCYDGSISTIYAYVDGSLSTGTGTAITLATASALVMGGRGSGTPTNKFTGSIEYVAVYDGYILDGTDITNLGNYGA